MNSPKVIILNGMATSGKSTFVSLCCNYNPMTCELSMVDFVKEIAEEIGWKGEKTERARKFLATLKDAISDYDENIIYNSIDKDINSYLESAEEVNEELNTDYEPVFFINAREPKDIDYLKNKYNAITLFITNNRVKPVVTNHADANVNNYKYDVYIENNGTLEEFEQKAKEFMENLNKENE